jgi:16S rRNA (cytidine1402-2'-O)-methyltransferase
VVIDAIAGASAVTTAFSIAGISGNAFTFLGFVPHKKGRETFFKSLADYDHPVMFYESVHRIMKTLESLVKYYGEDEQEIETEKNEENSTIDRTITITIARELTKMHEEVVQGTPAEVLKYFTDHPDHVRGEFVVLVS